MLVGTELVCQSCEDKSKHLHEDWATGLSWGDFRLMLTLLM